MPATSKQTSSTGRSRGKTELTDEVRYIEVDYDGQALKDPI